ncbi:MAG: hypothetical protein WBA23_02085 [Tunicatimonas sp.]|uniref:hypothetical protein n=1 Tax=Tunicatimonas sp. TaxID=1940096 RepID=UPI003C795906
MKNERAIEELLAEMLRKQDQQTDVLRLQADLLTDLSKNQRTIVGNLESLTGVVKSLDGRVETLNGKFDSLNGEVQGIKVAFNQSTDNAEHNFKLIIAELQAIRGEFKRMDEFERRLQMLEQKVG